MTQVPVFLEKGPESIAAPLEHIVIARPQADNLPEHRPRPLGSRNGPVPPSSERAKPGLIALTGGRREAKADGAGGAGPTRQPRQETVRRDPALGNVAHDLVDAVIERVHVLPGAPRGHLQPTAAPPFVQRAAR